MEFVIVAQSGLTRAGARLLTVLEKVHRAALLTPAQLEVSEDPGAGVCLIFLGEFDAADAARADMPAQFEAHGVTAGFSGHRAFVHAAPVEDPMATLQALNASVGDLQDSTGVELLAADTSDPSTLRGVHLAGMYLDPYLPVPAETEVARKIDFSPGRMCWERQYTFGIASFLAELLDAFVAAQEG